MNQLPSDNFVISKISGAAVPLRGDSIDTDRILPARYLRTVTFEGIGAHAFEDDRLTDSAHPFNQERFDHASILIVEKNFGCGSSREHAPQALKRRGIKAVVGVSFAEIFFHNCVAIGLPCLKASEPNVALMLETADQTPPKIFEIDLENLNARVANQILPLMLEKSIQQQFLNGTWNSTLTLLGAREKIEQTADSLFYLQNN